jgi:hypothetical protein
MKKLSLLLSLTIIFGNIIIGALMFALIYFHVHVSKLFFLSIVMALCAILYVCLNYWLNDELHNQFIVKRNLVSSKQNILYQLILLFILFISLTAAIIGPILGFELR